MTSIRGLMSCMHMGGNSVGGTVPSSADANG